MGSSLSNESIITEVSAVVPKALCPSAGVGSLLAVKPTDRRTGASFGYFASAFAGGSGVEYIVTSPSESCTLYK